MGVSHTHTHTHTHHTDTDTPKQTHTQRVEERRTTLPITQCVWGGEESSPQGQSAVTTDMTDRTVKGWEILPHPPRP